ncbi:D-glycero-beta-D-manno-heptose 1,7-bisphosphate 7-phosphatase [Desulfococcaceae bacterium HSG9]|nr:D-glycero-beta-D-manno-heptose 1,7-bisphosphate 7-phosphatase [Desulfococcaceae bacterium HSG9]
MKKIVFLDRDGVINRDSPNYIKNWSEFEFLPGALKALTRLTDNGFTTILITNQSAINRGLTSLVAIEHIHKMLKLTVESDGGRIRDIFFCPHRPDEACECRKPKPGLIWRASEKYGIDLSQTVMVGDNVKDIECAHNAGCGRAILVRTGSGVEAEKQMASMRLCPDYIVDDLMAAVNRIIDALEC